MPLLQANLIKLLGISMAAASLLSLSGCASIPPPREDMAVARFALNEAHEADASQYAPVELRNARKKLEAAEQAIAKGDYEEARRLAEQAFVDAQLAEAKAHTAIQQQDTEALRQSIETLRYELKKRNGGF